MTARMAINHVDRKNEARLLEKNEMDDPLGVQLDDFSIQLTIAKSSDNTQNDDYRSKGGRWLRSHPKSRVVRIDKQVTELKYYLSIHLQRHYSTVFTEPPIIQFYLSVQRMPSSTTSQLRYSLTGDLFFATTDSTLIPSKQDITAATLQAFSSDTKDELLDELRSASNPILRKTQSILFQQGLFDEDSELIHPILPESNSNNVDRKKLLTIIFVFIGAGFFLTLVIYIFFSLVTDKPVMKPIITESKKCDESDGSTTIAVSCSYSTIGKATKMTEEDSVVLDEPVSEWTKEDLEAKQRHSDNNDDSLMPVHSINRLVNCKTLSIKRFPKPIDDEQLSSNDEMITNFSDHEYSLNPNGKTFDISHHTVDSSLDDENTIIASGSRKGEYDQCPT